MKNLLWLLALCLLAFSCNNGSGDNAADEDSTAALNNMVKMDSGQAVMVTGLYEGTMPCADCSGIMTTINIKADSTVELNRTYQGAPHGDVTMKDSGRWMMKDHRLTFYLNKKNADTVFYMFSPDTLQMHDVQGKPIQSGMNYYLSRQRDSIP